VFDTLNYIEIYYPQNFMKFQLGIKAVTDSSNTIFAYCDFSHLLSVFTNLGDFSSNINIGTNYGALGVRIVGTMINVVPACVTAIEEGYAAGNFYDIGTCVGDITSLVFDSKL
jgi:hypothetical protein